MDLVFDDDETTVVRLVGNQRVGGLKCDVVNIAPELGHQVGPRPDNARPAGEVVADLVNDIVGDDVKEVLAKSPAFPRMMHICFYVRDDVDFNKFITDLEAESARRGMTQVRANRTIRVSTEEERRAAPESSHTNKVTVAPSDGWELIYCKGPEGEQIEFVKALGPVKQRFASALSARRRALGVAQ